MAMDVTMVTVQNRNIVFFCSYRIGKIKKEKESIKRDRKRGSLNV